MKAAEAVIQCLKEENVKVIFGYPGAAVVPIYEALRNSNIQHILVRQEQAAAHCASGYARARREVGVCIATSGPGALNLITGIATAYMDSIPMVIFTGQVKSTSIGKDVFQEADIIGATDGFTKHNYLIKNAIEIPRIIKEAFHIARTGRPGPVLIDLPVDMQNEDIEFEYSKELSLRGYSPYPAIENSQLQIAVQKIKNSQKPLLCVGGGTVSAQAENEVQEFINKTGIPMVHTLMGKDILSKNDPHYVGLIGSHGFQYANKAVEEADLLILIGTRVADRAIHGTEEFERKKDIIHIDIDAAEIGKNLKTEIPLIGDCKDILSQLLPMVEPCDIEDWQTEIKTWKQKWNPRKGYGNQINPQYVFHSLSKMLEDTAILVADVGQNQIWASHYFDIKGERRFFTSGGLGTMGYAIPAAIGCKIACPDKPIVATMGDGSFQMSLFELGTLAQNQLNIIFVLFNNSGLGMVREIQNKVYGANHGVQLDGNPDFVKIMEAYGLAGKRIYSNKEVKPAIMEAIKSRKAFLIECIVNEEESTL